MLKGFKDIVSEVAEPLSQGEKNFKDLHVKADNRDLVPGVTDQDFLFKGNPRRMDTPTASYEKEGEDDDSVKAYDKTLKREEVEQVSEKLTDDAKKNIRTALGPKTPDNELRKSSASAKAMIALAKTNSKNVKEDVEEIDELSKKTLGSYVKKATDDVSVNSYIAGSLMKPKALPYDKKAFSRQKGIEKAVDKMTKEEVEQIDEISKEMKDRYLKRSMDSFQSAWAHRRNAQSTGDKETEDKMRKVMQKRNKGMTRVYGENKESEQQAPAKNTNELPGKKIAAKMKDVDLLAARRATKMREEVEQIAEISDTTKKSYVNKAVVNLAKNAQHRGYREMDWGSKDSDKATNDRKVANRITGIRRATGSDEKETAAKSVAANANKYGQASFGGDHYNMNISRKATEKAMNKVKEDLELDDQVNEKTLTPAEMKKREEVVKAIKRENPKMDKSMAYAIATKTAKRVAEGTDTFALTNKEYISKDYKVKNAKYAGARTSEVEKMVRHDCAKHVAHEEWGVGTCIPEAHTIVETSEGEGYVTHYDIVFDHGIEFNVPVESLNILVSESHEHSRKNMKEDIDYDYEGEMAKAELNAICDKSRVLADMMEDDMQLEAWLQSKITKAKYMIDAVYDYLMYSNRNQAGTGPTPSTVTPSVGYNQSAAMTDTYGSFLNRMGEEVDRVEEAMSPEKKKQFAALAHPKDEITYADKIVGAKLQAAKEKATRRKSSSDDKESVSRDEMKEDTNSIIISDEELAKLEEIMKED